MRKINKSLLAVLVILALIVSAGWVSAHGRFNRGGRGFKHMKYQLTEEEMQAKREERKIKMEAVQTAMDSGNYEEWKTLVSERRPQLVNIITEDKFEKFVNYRNTMKANREAEQNMRDELGLPNKGLRGRRGRGRFGCRHMKGFKPGVIKSEQLPIQP